MSEIKNKLKNGRQTRWPARPGSEYIDNEDLSKWWKKPSLIVALFFGVITTMLLSNVKPFFPNALGGGLAVFFVNYIGLNWYLDRYDYLMTLHRKLVKREGLSTNWYKNGKKSAEENHKYGKLMSVMVWKPDGEKCPVTKLKDGNGVYVKYREDGTEISRYKYSNGERVED